MGQNNKWRQLKERWYVSKASGVGNFTKKMIAAFWITLATPIEGNLPSEWFDRKSFKARKVLLFNWIIFCLVMTTGYS